MIETPRFARVRAELARRAEVFDDPAAYLDGVEDALALLGDPVASERATARSGRDRRPVVAERTS